MSKCLYAFSADPITKGHRNVIERILKAHPNDELIIGIGVNPDKKYLFTLRERKLMSQNYLSDLNVKVESFEGMLTDYALENGVDVIYRGVRNSSDVSEELNIFYTLRMQNTEIEIHFIPAHEEMTAISASNVKAIVKEYGDISNLVCTDVKAALEAKLLGQYTLCLTGESGVGKTYTVGEIIKIAKIFGISTYHIDLDFIGHQILNKFTEDLYVKTRLEIAKEFGDEILLPDGFINRNVLSKIVFSNLKYMEKLNKIMYPAMIIQIAREKLKAGRGVLLIVDGALIIDFGWEKLFNNNIWFITVDNEIRVKRLHDRGLTDKQIQSMSNCQLSSEDKFNILQERNITLWELNNIQDANEPGEWIKNQLIFIIQKLDQFGELRFKGLWKRLQADGNSSIEYDKLVAIYSESHRHYHTLSHIVDGLDDMWKWSLSRKHIDVNAVELAWWFHDAVYKEQSCVNEKRSAQLAKSVCEHALLNTELTNHVQELIMDTEHVIIPNTVDGKFISDIDLLIFSKSNKIFSQYCEDIRKEYGWVEQKEFRINRQYILKTFLNKIKTKSLYYSITTSHSWYLKRACLNLQNELNNLKREDNVKL